MPLTTTPMPSWTGESLLVLQTWYPKSLLPRCSRNQAIIFWDLHTCPDSISSGGPPASLFLLPLVGYPSLFHFFSSIHRIVFSLPSPQPNYESHQFFGLLGKKNQEDRKSMDNFSAENKFPLGQEKTKVYCLE